MLADGILECTQKVSISRRCQPILLAGMKQVWTNMKYNTMKLNLRVYLFKNIYVGFALRLELGLRAWNESLLALDVIIMQ